jgi:hypothetical protein
MTSRVPGPTFALLAAVLLFAHASPGTATAHGGVTVGPYEIEVAWRIEPAVVGVANAVQVSIAQSAAQQPVNDLSAGALSVTVTPTGRDSSTHPLGPAFDVASGTGAAGTYEAAFVPTVAGDYALHVTGSIHGTAVDFTVENSVDATATPEPGAGLDPLLLVGGAVILLVVGGMAFLLFRVRPASA